MSSAAELRHQVIKVYKQLSFLGRDYPLGAQHFHNKLKEAFLKNRDVSDPREIKRLIRHAKFVAKDLEALYSVKKYRELKKRYYNEDSWTLEEFKKLESLTTTTPSDNGKK